MSLYRRKRWRGDQQTRGNVFWRDIERAKERLDLLTAERNGNSPLSPAEDGFIRDLYRRGDRYQMSQKQMRWLPNVINKLYR